MTDLGVIASFEVESFAWQAGAFEVSGRWRADREEALGRVRLLVEVDGRQKNIGAQGGKTATATPDGAEWSARFLSTRRPDSVGTATLLVTGLELLLPEPEIGDEAPPEPAPVRRVREPQAENGNDETIELLQALRSERAAADEARHRLAAERRAAEEVANRLRAGAAPRRELEPTSTSGGTPPEVAYALAAGIVLLMLIVLVWLV